MGNIDDLRWHSVLTDEEQYEITIFANAEEEMRALGEYEVADLIRLTRERFLTENGHRRPVVPAPTVETPAPAPREMDAAHDTIWWIGPILTRGSKLTSGPYLMRGNPLRPGYARYAEMKGPRIQGNWPPDSSEALSRILAEIKGGKADANRVPANDVVICLRLVEFPEVEGPPGPCLPPVYGEDYFF